MKTGFWLTPDIDAALESAHLSTGDEASIFLHGLCGIFALLLHEKFGYELEYIVDENEPPSLTYLVHVYCHEKNQFIDIRGRTNDKDTFMAEFEDFFERYVTVPVDADTLAKALTDWTDSETLTRYTDAARAFIQAHTNYYERR